MNLIFLPRTVSGTVVGIVWGILATLSQRDGNLLSLSNILLFLPFSLIGAELGTYVCYNLEERQHAWLRVLIGAGVGLAMAIFMKSPIETEAIAPWFSFPSLVLISLGVSLTVSSNQAWAKASKIGVIGALLGLAKGIIVGISDDLLSGSPQLELLASTMIGCLVLGGGYMLSWILIRYPIKKFEEVNLST